MADISSITLPGGGTYNLKDKNAVPKYGMGKNLLRNWYFVGGGTGRGVFPVNQRGNSTYSLNGYTIDGWNSAHNSNFGSVTLTASGLVLAHPQATGNTRIEQHTGLPSGGFAMLSILTSNDLYFQKVALFTSSGSYAFGNIGVTLPINTDAVCFTVYGNTSETIKAVKLEFGEEQTLAHQENGIWVLNEIPDYEYELYRCMISTADPSDTYANKSLATEQQLAHVEPGATASRAYAVGEYFCWNGLLYRAKTAISSGEPFTVETNCEKKTIGEELTTRTVLSGQYSSSALSTVYTEGITLEYNASGTMPYYGLIVTIKRGNGNGRCIQIAIPRQDNSSDFSIRSTNNNAWTSWVKYTGIRQS